MYGASLLLSSLEQPQPGLRSELAWPVVWTPPEWKGIVFPNQL